MAAQLPPRFTHNALALGVFFALYPLAASNSFANSQYSCTAGPDGQWQCAAQSIERSIPRPEQITAEAPARASTASTPHTPDAAVIPDEQLSPTPIAATASHKSDSVVKTRGYALSTRSEGYQHLDWVPRHRLSAEQQAEIAPYCGGRYVEPLRLGRDDTTPMSEAPIYANAVRSHYDQETLVTTLTEDVLIRQSSIQAEADHARLDQLHNTGVLAGHVRLRDKNILIAGDRANMQLDTGEMQIDNAEYVVHSMDARGAAQYIKREEDGIIRLKSGSYTSCAPQRNDWHIESNNISLNQLTGFGHATNAVLRVKNIPVMYTPYIYFPIDDRRQSGFLAPQFSYSSKKGMDITTPYYFNLAPNYDATLYPNYMSKRGLLTEGEFRYLGKAHEGQLGGGWLGDDDEDERKHQSGYEKDRWMVNWQHRQTFADSRLLATVDYSNISDPYYFQDLNSNIIASSSSTLDQRATLTWRGNNYTAGLNLHAYERANITDVTPYDKLPQLTLDGRVPGELGGLQLNYKTELVRFERSLQEGQYKHKDWEPGDALETWSDANLRGLNRAEGNRAHIEPTLSLPFERVWGFIKPSIKLTHTRYDLDIDSKGESTLHGKRRFDSSPSRTVPIYSVDTGLYFDRPTQLFGKNYIQTLEPRLMYLYVPYRDQSDIPLFDTSESTFDYNTLFRDNRFTGRDRIGDTNQVSLGLTWRWLQDNGVERQSVSIGQAYYFTDRKALLNPADKSAYKEYSVNTSDRSPYAGRYMLRFNDDLRMTADYVWDPDTHSPRSGSVMLNYQSQENLNKIINIGYRYKNDGVWFDRDQGRYISGGRHYTDTSTTPPTLYEDYYKIKQHDFSFIWPLTDRWNVIGRWQHDYNHERTLEAMGGLEYNSCCWKVRLVNRYWQDYDEHSMRPEDNRDPDRGIFLQVILKGLGTVSGGKVEPFLSEGIPGYQQREENAY